LGVSLPRFRPGKKTPIQAADHGEPATAWDFDTHCLGTHTHEVLALSHRVRRAFSVPASDILVTKTMLGVFGCVPAFDRYFYIGHQAKIDARRIFTLDFDSGLDTKRRYSIAKVIDMIFFQERLNRERDRS
jgi:hypothetical protein